MRALTWFLLSGTAAVQDGFWVGGSALAQGLLLLLTPARFPTARCVCVWGGGVL